MRGDANGDFVGSGLTGVIGNFIGGKYESLEAGSTHEFSLSALTHAGLPDGLMFEVSGFGILAEP